MEAERFGKFTLLIDNISKCVHKIKVDTVPYLGIKSVHVFWICTLYHHPEGLTATEIAASRQVDRSLVSREIAELCSYEYIEYIGGTGKRRNYNSRLVLTEKGKELRDKVFPTDIELRNMITNNISEEELAITFATLEKMNMNIRDKVKLQI